MALSAEVTAVLNEQINKEMYSAYLYLTFADYYDDRGLKGFANWYEIQAKEEMDHALAIRRYPGQGGDGPRAGHPPLPAGQRLQAHDGGHRQAR